MGIYKFWSRGKDLTGRPYKLGEHMVFLWEELQPTRGDPNWEPLNSALARGAGYGNPPAMVSVVFSLSSHTVTGFPENTYYDCTPGWVYDLNYPGYRGKVVGHLLQLGDRYATIPAYDVPEWRNAALSFIRLLGDRLNGDGRVACVIVCTGLDGEPQATKNEWVAAMQEQASAVEKRFEQFVLGRHESWIDEDGVIDTYGKAFPNTRLYVNYGPTWKLRAPMYDLAVQYGMGIKNNGAQPSLNSHQGGGVYVGAWDPMAWAMQSGVPTACETSHWMDWDNKMWTIPAVLHYHPEEFNLHGDWIESDDGEYLPEHDLAYLASHMGLKVGQTPDVWCHLRGSEYPERDDEYAVTPWTTQGQEAWCSDHIGNWDYYMHMLDESITQRMWKQEGDPSDYFSRQYRRITVGYFEPEDGWPYTRATLSIVWLARPGVRWHLEVEGSHWDIEGPPEGEAKWKFEKFVTDVGLVKITSEDGVDISYISFTRLTSEPEPEPDLNKLVEQVESLTVKLEEHGESLAAVQVATHELSTRVSALIGMLGHIRDELG